MKIDLDPLPEDYSYEDRYQQYMAIFKDIAHTPGDKDLVVHNAPWCWIPLLHHLNCKTVTPKQVFEHCDRVRGAWPNTKKMDRTTLEVLSCFRPETVDALWKCDMQWEIPPGRVRIYPHQRAFIVTNNGSYHRREVTEFSKLLRSYKPTKQKVLLVPCAADKPYPSPMMQACLDMLPPDYYLMNATGVLGLVPQDLWEYMPYYDSGIPNEWRLYRTIKWYFHEHAHTDIVVYCDYYSEAILYAFNALHMLERVKFVLPVKFYYDYLDLMLPNRLEQLRAALWTGNNS